MNQTYLRLLFRPKLEKLIMIVGLPGIGNIGGMVAQLLIKAFQAKLFAEMYSPSFPDYVTIDNRGICRPPRYEFHVSADNRNIIILTGDAQLPLENIPVHHEICGEVLDFISEIGCGFTITVDGVPSPQPTKEIYLAATSKKLATKYSEKDVTLFKSGRIIGPAGLLLGLAKIRGLEGICILGQTMGLAVDQEASFNVYKFLRKVLETYIKLNND